MTVQGAFTEGGNSSGVVQDHQDNFELQNYSTATEGNHALRFGTRCEGVSRRELLDVGSEWDVYVQLTR